MTARQATVLTYLRFFIAAHQRPPSLRELAKHFGWKGTSAANDYIRALEKHGAIARDQGHVRVLGAALEWRIDGEPSRAELLHQLELARTALKEFA